MPAGGAGIRSPRLACIVLGAALAASSPASAQFILSENSSYPTGVGDQFPPGATSVSSALAYSFQVQNLTGVGTQISQITLSLGTTGIASGDIANLVLLSDPGALVANGSVVGNSLVFTSLVGHTVSPFSTRRYVLRWDVVNLSTGDSAQVDVSASGILPNPTSGDAAAVTHLVEAPIPALGVTARLVLVAMLGVAGAAALCWHRRRDSNARPAA